MAIGSAKTTESGPSKLFLLFTNDDRHPIYPELCHILLTRDANFHTDCPSLHMSFLGFHCLRIRHLARHSLMDVWLEAQKRRGAGIEMCSYVRRRVVKKAEEVPRPKTSNVRQDETKRWLIRAYGSLNF
ncbi:hypothetical protein BT69DRAFT_1343258 [Atractiella rhizophila]|nr:hypothetical protein BT69DRAFT_1343258 [Atractiella rhizophila]